MIMLDPDRLAGAIDGLYEAAAAPRLWPSALAGFAEAAGGSDSLVLHASPDRGGFVCSSGMKEAVDAYLVEGWAPRNVREVKGSQALRAGQGVFTNETLFRRDELYRSAIQNDFFDRFDMRCFIGYDFVPGLIHGNIERNRHEVAAWELDTLRTMLPHLHRIGQLAQARGLGIEDGTTDALDALDVGAVLVDCDGRLVRMNARAEATCPSVLAIDRGVMRCRDRGSSSAFERLVLEASSRHVDVHARFLSSVPLRRDGRRPVIARAVPLKGAAHDVFRRAKALLLLFDPEEPRAAAADLGRIFDLTATETRVAQRIANGESIAAVAQAMAISVVTVRTHLKAVFLKTGTHRQAELGALLGRLP